MSSCMGGRRCGRGARGLRRASGPFVRLMTAAKAAITFITQKTGSSTALSTPCALQQIYLRLYPSLASLLQRLSHNKFSFLKHKITTFVSTTKPDAMQLLLQRHKGQCILLLISSLYDINSLSLHAEQHGGIGYNLVATSNSMQPLFLCPFLPQYKKDQSETVFHTRNHKPDWVLIRGKQMVF